MWYGYRTIVIFNVHPLSHLQFIVSSHLVTRNRGARTPILLGEPRNPLNFEAKNQRCTGHQISGDPCRGDRGDSKYLPGL